MEKHRWERIEELYHSALELPADMRSTFLSEACAGDPDLVREVQDLIAHDPSTRDVAAAGFRFTPRGEITEDGSLARFETIPSPDALIPIERILAFFDNSGFQTRELFPRPFRAPKCMQSFLQVRVQR